MENKGVVYAMDRDSKKLSKLDMEMRRLGISVVTTFCHDLTAPLLSSTLPSFDKVLLDSPCSGLGVLRRNPDAKWSASKSDLKRLRNIQLRLIANVASLVKPSGDLVYVVCSTEPEENESVVAAFLKAHPNFQSENLHAMELLPDDCITQEGFFRTYPHRLTMDGFFAAKFRRIS
jgi:16S rRNA (cytosine967-C5)-methyltransferase